MSCFCANLFPSAVVFDDRCAVIAFSGLSLAPTHHLFIMDEAKLYTWCAFDALFLPEILRKPAALITQCPGSGAELTVQLAPSQVRAAPPGCVVSIVMPGTKSCRNNLRKAFCDHVNLFKNEQTFMIWSKGRQDVRCVTLGEAEVFARQRNALRYPDLDLSALPQSCDKLTPSTNDDRGVNEMIRQSSPTVGERPDLTKLPSCRHIARISRIALLQRSMIFVAIGFGVFYSSLQLSHYIPEALSTGAILITLLNSLYYRHKAARC